MKKEKLIELIQENINGGSFTSDIYKIAHPLVIEKYIDMAFNTIFYNIFRQNPEELDIYGRWYWNQPVLSQNGKDYSKLPCGIIQLPKNSSSIRRITLVDDDVSMSFINVKNSSGGILERLGTIERSGAIKYYVSNRIWYDNINGIKEVNIFAITPFSDLDSDDDIPIPAGQDVQFLQMVLQIMQKKYNDLNSNNNGN